jgi:hypothetical protein
MLFLHVQKSNKIYQTLLLNTFFGCLFAVFILGELSAFSVFPSLKALILFGRELTEIFLI